MPVDEFTFLVGVITVGLLLLFLGYVFGRKVGGISVDKRWENKLPGLLKETRDRSRTVLAGRFSEQLAPYLPDFPYSPTEVRFVGSPVDFIVFPGIDEKEPTEIVFVEVKSGRSTLTHVQRKLRDIVQAGKIGWEEYRVPSDFSG